MKISSPTQTDHIGVQCVSWLEAALTAKFGNFCSFEALDCNPMDTVFFLLFLRTWSLGTGQRHSDT
eukprot:5754500-Amphidinium_carterae.1